MRRLRLTRRALADLGLSIDDRCTHDAREYRADHEVIAKFVGLREQSPIGQETTQLPASTAVVWNLHAGRYRGLTWHDESDDVVWLLGVGLHESGSDDDAYAILKTRDADDELFPSIADFEDAEPTEVAWFLELLATSAPKLREAAGANPNVEIREQIADAVRVAAIVEVIVVDDGEMSEEWLAIRQPPAPPEGKVLPPEWMMYVVAAFFPDAESDQLCWGGDFPRTAGSQPDEIVVHWPHP